MFKDVYHSIISVSKNVRGNLNSVNRGGLKSMDIHTIAVINNHVLEKWWYGKMHVICFKWKKQKLPIFWKTNMYIYVYPPHTDLFEESTSKVQGCLSLGPRISWMMLIFFPTTSKFSIIIIQKNIAIIYFPQLFKFKTSLMWTLF